MINNTSAHVFQEQLYLTLVTNRSVNGLNETIDESAEFRSISAQENPEVFRLNARTSSSCTLQTDGGSYNLMGNEMSMKHFMDLIVSGRNENLKTSNDLQSSICLYSSFDIDSVHNNALTEYFDKVETDLKNNINYKTLECVIKIREDRSMLTVYAIYGFTTLFNISSFHEKYRSFHAKNVILSPIESTTQLQKLRKNFPMNGCMNVVGPRLSDINVLWFEYLVERITKSKWSINRCLFENYNITHKHMNELSRIAKEVDEPEADRKNVRVIVLTGSSRTGKSWFAKKYLSTSSTYFCGADCTAYFQGYHNQKNIVIDEIEQFGSRGYMTGKQLLLLTNKGHCRLNVKFSSVQIVATTIFLISNFEVQEWFPGDQMTLSAFNNRVHWFGRCVAQNIQPNWVEGTAMNDVRRHASIETPQELPPFVNFESNN